MTLSIATFCFECHYAECHISFIVMLNVVMLNVVMLNVVMLNVVMLNVVMLSVVMLNVVAPYFGIFEVKLNSCQVKLVLGHTSSIAPDVSSTKELPPKSSCIL